MSSNPFLQPKLQSERPKIAILGECMIELSGTPLSPLNQSFSGDTLNTALYLSRLTSGLELDLNYATAVGTDAFSDAMIAQWQQEEIGCQFVSRLDDKNPGLYFIQVDKQGERSFSYWRDDSAARVYLERDGATQILEMIANLDLLYISGISLAILPPSSRSKLLHAIKRMRVNGGKLAFDNNYRPLLWSSKGETKEVYSMFMAECDLALLTLDDEIMLRGDIDEESVLEHCKELGINEAVIKRGAAPCLIQHLNTTTEVAALKVSRVVDTTAAGDSFSAAYIAARLHNLPPKVAARWGHSLAGQVIQHPGAIIPTKYMPQLTQNIKED